MPDTVKHAVQFNLVYLSFSLASLRIGLVIISICMNLIISEQDQLRPRWFDY